MPITQSSKHEEYGHKLVPCHTRFPDIQCPRLAQIFLLAAFVIHFLGVLSEPLHFFSRSNIATGPEFVFLGETMKPYSQWLYMNHGYFFFAPNPGPGHLIQCTLSSSGTEPVQTITLPDRNEHWPRLLYHRYFMLSEFYTSRFAPRQVTEDLKKDSDFMAGWTTDRVLYDQIQSSIIASLEHSTGKEKIALRRIERLLPDPEQVNVDGWTLNDTRLTEILPESMIDTAKTAPVSELPAKTTNENRP